MTHPLPKQHNAMWPGLVGKGGDEEGAESAAAAAAHISARLGAGSVLVSAVAARTTRSASSRNGLASGALRSAGSSCAASSDPRSFSTAVGIGNSPGDIRVPSPGLAALTSARRRCQSGSCSGSRTQSCR